MDRVEDTVPFTDQYRWQSQLPQKRIPAGIVRSTRPTSSYVTLILGI